MSIQNNSFRILHAESEWISLNRYTPNFKTVLEVDPRVKQQSSWWISSWAVFFDHFKSPKRLVNHKCLLINKEKLPLWASEPLVCILIPLINLLFFRICFLDLIWKASARNSRTMRFIQSLKYNIYRQINRDCTVCRKSVCGAIQSDNRKYISQSNQIRRRRIWPWNCRYCWPSK